MDAVTRELFAAARTNPTLFPIREAISIMTKTNIQ